MLVDMIKENSLHELFPNLYHTLSENREDYEIHVYIHIYTRTQILIFVSLFLLKIPLGNCKL